MRPTLPSTPMRALNQLLLDSSVVVEVDWPKQALLVVLISP